MKYLFIIICLSTYTISAQQSHSFNIVTDNYSKDSLIISYTYGKETLVLDTLLRNKKDYFTLNYSYKLPIGMYYIESIDRRQKIPFLLSKHEDFLSAIIDFKVPTNITFKHSPSNITYRKYLNEIKEIEGLRNSAKTIQKLDSISYKLNIIRQKYINKTPKTIATSVIKSEIEWTNPPFKDIKRIDKKELLLKYEIQHYLDNIDLSNPNFIHFPNYHKTITEYFDRILHLKPDTLIPVLDNILSKMGYTSETFRYYLPFFERKYSFAFRPWADKVYIHIAKKYYKKNITYWLTEHEISRINDLAKRKEGSLPGKKIPDITLVDKDNNPVRLWDIKAKYMLIIFWRPGCSHCMHAMPYIKKIQKKYSQIKIISICTRQRSDTYRCWDGIKNEKMECFDFNLADKLGTSDFLNKFNIGGIPNIFLIDKDKKIIRKKIAPTLLEREFEKILKSKQ